MTAIETKNLSFSYGDKRIIDDITFTAAAGEAWAVIGRNGAGKSTLLKCLCGLLKSHAGTIFINGVDIAQLPPRETAQRIAYVPQGHNRQAPPFTVREYVTMARFPYGGFLSSPSKNDRDRVDGALAVTGTASLADRSMNALSGGELQSALIAGAIAQDTPFLLLDEPTTHLDPCHQEKIRQLINRVHRERGTTVITVTHDVNLALSTHNNILALIGGKTAFCGTKDEFCTNDTDNLRQIFQTDFCGIEYSGGKKIYVTNGDPS